MEQVMNEPTIYSAAVYCRLSKDDEQAGESVSIETQKMMLEGFATSEGFPFMRSMRMTFFLGHLGQV